MEKISAYVLTKNSELHLHKILTALSAVSDEVLVIDSGSTDSTKKISESFGKVRFLYNEFKNFRDQRTFAANACSNDMVLFLDSDEIPDDTFVRHLNNLKQTGFNCDAYTVKRYWNVLGKDIRCLYPVESPDDPIRLYRKSKVSFENSNLVHETPEGYETLGELEGRLNHITFGSKEELYQKIDFYTTIASNDLLRKKKKANPLKRIFSPTAAFIKWYLLKKGYKDGRIGWLLGVYAYKYTLMKHIKTNQKLKQQAQ